MRPIIVLVLLGFLLSLRIYPALTLPPHGDEGADLIALYRDYVSAPRFFDADISIAAEQSRLSHLIAAAAIAVIGLGNLNMFTDIGLVRLVFFLVHLVYLSISYYFLKDMLKSPSAALLYVSLLVTSCYLSSYSTAVMTTGESVYMVFHILAIWIFYRNFRQILQSGGAFRQFSLLCIVLACCISSKLFGLLLLLAFAIFHLVHLSRVSTLRYTGLAPKYLLSISLSFFMIIVLINLVSLPLKVKSIAALSIGILYLLFWIVLAFKERKKGGAAHKINFVYFWGLLTFCCFTLVLVISPIYLNLQNFFDVFNWFNTWGPESIQTESSKLDALIILLIKFGPIPSLLLLLTLSGCLWRLVNAAKEQRVLFLNSVYFLMSLVVLLNVLLISTIHLKLPWHGISIFPFMFLPFIALFMRIKTYKSFFLRYFIVLFLVIIVVDNVYRYSYWYPYGHFDGGQYGRSQIGLNKSCLISFEVVPKFYTYFTSLSQKEDNTYRIINVKGADDNILNNYLIQMLKAYFSFKGHGDVIFRSNQLKNDASDLIVSSPIFTPNVEHLLRVNAYQKLKTLSIADIAVANVWRGKRG